MSFNELLEQLNTAVSTGTLPDLGAWSYIILMLLVFVEGPAATLVAGAMAAAGILRVDLVLICSIVANFLADTFWYLLGYTAAKTALPKNRWLRRRWHMVTEIEQAMQGRAARMYLLTKVSLGLLTIPILIASGLTRVSWPRLLVVSLAVEPIWNGMLVLAGYRLGDSVAHLDRGLRIAAIVGAVLGVLVLIYFYRRMFARIFALATVEAPAGQGGVAASAEHVATGLPDNFGADSETDSMEAEMVMVEAADPPVRPKS